MNRVLHFYRLLNILSIDVAAGAVICAVFFAHVLKVHIRPYGLIALGLTVWIIYTLDHLLDARRVKSPAATERHRFHQHYFKRLSFVVVAAMLIDVLQIFFIRMPVLMGGVLLAILVVLYFFVQRHVNYVKEVFGALLYCGGVLLAPLCLMDKPLTFINKIQILQFGIIALINLLLFSLFDNERDLQDKHQSFTTSFGVKATQTVLAILFIVNTTLIVTQVRAEGFQAFTFTMASMNAILLIIRINKKYFEVNDRYRLLGDAIFLLPLFYFLI